jgi:hypothetical protein
MSIMGRNGSLAAMSIPSVPGRPPQPPGALMHDVVVATFRWE